MSNNSASSAGPAEPVTRQMREQDSRIGGRRRNGQTVSEWRQAVASAGGRAEADGALRDARKCRNGRASPMIAVRPRCGTRRNDRPDRPDVSRPHRPRRAAGRAGARPRGLRRARRVLRAAPDCISSTTTDRPSRPTRISCTGRRCSRRRTVHPLPARAPAAADFPPARRLLAQAAGACPTADWTREFDIASSASPREARGLLDAGQPRLALHRRAGARVRRLELQRDQPAGLARLPALPPRREDALRTRVHARSVAARRARPCRGRGRLLRRRLRVRGAPGVLLGGRASRAGTAVRQHHRVQRGRRRPALHDARPAPRRAAADRS